ncbi:outer membrane protein, adhesin transport system [Pseudomonas chlororaphis]|uniref:TolC family outer membrane protein n=1 Tax=Pseudomonas chlororaphis TaxID=587753 RepID=UPI0039E41B62
MRYKYWKAGLITVVSSIALLGFSEQVIADTAPRPQAQKHIVCNPQCAQVSASPAPAPQPAQSVPAQPVYKQSGTTGKRNPFSYDRLPAMDGKAARAPFASANQAPVQADDLWQVVSLAVSHYPSIRDAASVLEEQREGVDVARAGYLPKVDVGISSGRQSFGSNGQALSLTASQMLYDFGKVGGAVSEAESNVVLQQVKWQGEIDDIALQAAEAVIEVRRYEALVNAAQSQKEQLKKLQQLAARRVSEGASTQADLIQAQSRVEAAEASLLASQTQLSQQRSKLRTLIGQEPLNKIAVPENRLVQALATIDPNVEMTIGVQQAEAEWSVAQAQVSQARANAKPTVSLDAGVDKYLGNVPTGRDEYAYTLTVSVKHSLFDGGAPSARIRGAGQAARAAEERIHTRKLEAQNSWFRLQEQMAGLSSRIKVLGDRYKSMVDTRALYEQQYLALGTRSLLDLLNAEQEIFQAQTDQENSRHDLWLAQVNYINATGHMRNVFALMGASS